MSTQTTEQQNALKDAMARAKEIAARLQQNNNEESVVEKPDTTEQLNTLDQPDTNEDLSETESGKRKAFGESDEQPEPKRLAPPTPLMSINEPPKKNFGPMLVEEISLPNNIMGLVMGKGGTMINKLQVASGTKLQVSSEEISDHRLVTITGNAEAVAKAKGLLEEIQATGKVPDQLLMDPDAFNSEMSIPKEKAGLVIGRGGEMIKSLMERSGCKIVLIQDGPYAEAPEKLLRFSGEQDSVMYGKQLVQDLLANKLGNMNNRMPPQGSEYMEINVPKEAIGLIIGTRGSNIQELQHQTGCKVQFQKEMQGNFKVCTLSGTPEQVETASNMINEMIRTGDSGFGPPMMNGPRPRFGGPPRGPPMGPRGPPNWGPQHPGPRPRMQRGPGPRPPPGHKSLYLEVPANKCGLVIGKGGETIKQIKGESQANIQLDRSIPDESPFRVLRMNGTDESIDMAVQMIRDRIDDQSLVMKNEATDGPPGQGSSNQWGGQDQWGGQNQGNWGPPQDNNQQWGDQWNQQQQWGGQQQQQQSGWGGQPQQQGGWGQQQQGGNQAWDQQQSWNQPQQSYQNQQPQQQQQSYPQQPAQQTQSQPQSQTAPKPQQNQQGQQWQPQSSSASAQWPNQQQQQWSQSAATSSAQTSQAYQQASTAPASTSTTSSDASQTQAGSQPQQDYSAAWALYYQQQQQYYQQYYAQQAQAAAAAAVSAGTTSTPGSTVSTQGTANSSQATSMAQYQAQYAEYQKQYGQQQQQAPQ